MSTILIIDDEPAIAWSLKEILSDEGHDVALAADIPSALAAARAHAPDAMLLDIRLGGHDGIDALPELRAAAGPVPVVVMTAFGDLNTAVRAVQAGAFDYLVKPFDLERITQVVTRALADRVTSPAIADPPPQTDLIGSSPAMQEVFKHIALVSASDLPVLITGPTGSGKEVVARAIHRHSARHDKPLVTTNLAALAPGVIESELFGHAAGAFTGATVGRPGLFELADGGTIFLDEIGEAPTEVQVKLLRALETSEVTRVGEAIPRPVHVRVVAATNRDLTGMLGTGTFRVDLYHRLKVFPIEMPSLAERLDDIEPLARHFLARQATGRPGGGTPLLTPEFLEALRRRPWPGNVRELKHAIEYSAVVARGGVLRPEHLPAQDATGPAASGSALTAAASRLGVAVKEWSAAARREFMTLPEPDLHHRAVLLLEASLLQEALAHTGGNRTAAAKLLGLDRATLRTKLRLLGIDD